jgi:flavin-dependent dehydrogenase
MSGPASVESDVPVLIAGGGLIGLSAAMFLAQHGISSLAVERLRGGSQLPRAAFFHMRTLEMFRSAGIEDEVREQSRKEFEPEGALIIMDTLAGKKLADIIPSLNEGVDALSPCRRLFVTQPGLEPILRRRAEAAGAKVIDGYEAVGVEQDADGVTLTAQDVETGQQRKLRGRYLLGADGAHSRIRELLGIPFDGRGVFSNSITIYFHADLGPQLLGKQLSVVYINNGVVPRQRMGGDVVDLLVAHPDDASVVQRFEILPAGAQHASPPSRRNSVIRHRRCQNGRSIGVHWPPSLYQR